MNKQDLIEYLFLQIESRGIKIIRNDSINVPAIVNIDKGLMAYNGFMLTPFILAHENQHILHGDIHRGGENDTCNPQEIRANKKAIEYLWDIFIENGGSFDYFSLFVEMTDCPFYMAYDVISKNYQKQEYELNKIDSLKEIEDDELQRCIVEYISCFDVIDEINVYTFLDAYHLAYNLCERASVIFQEIISGNNYQTA